MEQFCTLLVYGYIRQNQKKFKCTITIDVNKITLLYFLLNDIKCINDVNPEKVFNIFNSSEIRPYGANTTMIKAHNNNTKELFYINLIERNKSNEFENVVTKRMNQWNATSPNIVMYHSLYFHDDKYWFLYNYYDVVSLFDIISSSLLLESEIQQIIIQILYKLHVKNRYNVYFGDEQSIRSENIILTKNGIIQLNYSLIDTGTLVMDNVFINGISGCSESLTPYWMAPECLTTSQDAKTYDKEKQNVWSVGILCYELATSKPPLFKINHLVARHIIPKPECDKDRKLKNDNDLWSSQFCNFIDYCCQRKIDNRPNIKQLLEHEWIKGVNIDYNKLKTLYAKSVGKIKTRY